MGKVAFMESFLERWSRAIKGTPLLLLVMAFCALFVRLQAGPHPGEDAFITFKYARNIASGQGFVYNMGERVLGTSTLLYALLLSGFCLFWRDLPWLSVGINAVSDGVSCLILYSLATEMGSPLAGLVMAFIYAFFPVFWWMAVSGMETSLFLCLLLLSYYVYVKGRYSWAAILCAALCLTRLEGFIAAFTLFCGYLLQRRRLPVKEMALFGLCLVPWLLFTLVYFGSPVPNSVMAKNSAYLFSDRFQAFRAMYGNFISEVFPFFNQYFLRGWLVIRLLLIAVSSLAIIKNKPLTWPFFLFPILYILSFGLANKLMFSWYLPPLLPFYMLSFLIGAFFILERTLSGLQRLLPSGADFLKRGELYMVKGGLLLALPFFLLHHVIVGPKGGVDQLSYLYRHVAQELNSSSESDSLLASPEIGTLGYYFRGRILDTVGLVSPEAIGHNPADLSGTGGYSIPPDLIEEQKPDFVVSYELFIKPGEKRKSLLTSDFFLKNYQEVMAIKGYDQAERGDLLVFKRIKGPKDNHS